MLHRFSERCGRVSETTKGMAIVRMMTIRTPINTSLCIAVFLCCLSAHGENLLSILECHRDQLIALMGSDGRDAAVSSSYDGDKGLVGFQVGFQKLHIGLLEILTAVDFRTENIEDAIPQVLSDTLITGVIDKFLGSISLDGDTVFRRADVPELALISMDPVLAKHATYEDYLMSVSKIADDHTIVRDSFDELTRDPLISLIKGLSDPQVHEGSSKKTEHEIRHICLECFTINFLANSAEPFKILHLYHTLFEIRSAHSFTNPVDRAQLAREFVGHINARRYAKWFPHDTDGILRALTDIFYEHVSTYAQVIQNHKDKQSDKIAKRVESERQLFDLMSLITTVNWYSHADKKRLVFAREARASQKRVIALSNNARHRFTGHVH